MSYDYRSRFMSLLGLDSSQTQSAAERCNPCPSLGDPCPAPEGYSKKLSNLPWPAVTKPCNPCQPRKVDLCPAPEEYLNARAYQFSLDSFRQKIHNRG